MIRVLLFTFIFPAVAFADFDKIKSCLENRYYKLESHRSIAVTVVSKKRTEFLTFGKASVDQIFEIGSITKTFTGTLLAQEVINKALRLSDSIPTEYQKRKKLINYKHLATHTSGIIGGVFNGFEPKNPESPYAGLDRVTFKQLYGKTDLLSRPGKTFLYSNIATGLLGIILSERNNKPYEQLVQDSILNVLGMNDTYFTVPNSEIKRFPLANVNGEPFSHWDLEGSAISAAGGIRSTISDMAIYAKANLHPSKDELGTSLALAQKPLRLIKEGESMIGMYWMNSPKQQLVWHNGSTVGFNSILAISKKHNLAVVALTDTGILKQDKIGTYQQDQSFQNVVFECLR